MHRMVKDRIGKHEIICPLGEGGMAEVYLGFSRGLADVNKLVVMKLIRSELARDKRFVNMFLDEARLATRLNHTNVVHTYDVLEDAGQYVLTMEYLEGQALFDVFQRIDLQYFPLDLHLWILTQVLAGLQYAHALPDYNGSPLGVVHRDVSPENVFVTYNGEVKLLDFGIAKAAGAVSVTNRGTFKGKLAYCAPEQLEGDDPLDARADIFSVGVMLWEALAGKRIEVGDSCAQLAQTRLRGGEPRIREVRPDVAPALAEICDRAMALKPADRYLSAVDLQRDLERYLEESGKRGGRAELGDLMRGHFEIERRSVRKQIQEHLLAVRKAPVASHEAPSEPQAPVHGSRSRVTALCGTVPRSFRNRDGKTQEASSPPAMWAAKPSVLPETLAASILPLPEQKPPARRRRSLTSGVLILAAVLAGGSAAAIGVWNRLPGTRASAPLSPEVAPSNPLPVPPSESPRPALATVFVPAAAPVLERGSLDVQLSPPATKAMRVSRFHGRAGKKSHPALRARARHDGSQRAHASTPQKVPSRLVGAAVGRPAHAAVGSPVAPAVGSSAEPDVAPAVVPAVVPAVAPGGTSVGTPFVEPGMDLGRLAPRESEVIDESNPYTP